MSNLMLRHDSVVNEKVILALPVANEPATNVQSFDFDPGPAIGLHALAWEAKASFGEGYLVVGVGNNHWIDKGHAKPIHCNHAHLFQDANLRRG